MRDIYLFTQNPMVYAECNQAIFANVKNVKTNQKGLFWSSSKTFWTFDILNETVFEGASDPGYIEELREWAKNIPIEDPFINYLEVHRSIDAKRIIQALMPLYPELYVDADDTAEADWYGTAQEYLDTEFDY